MKWKNMRGNEYKETSEPVERCHWFIRTSNLKLHVKRSIVLALWTRCYKKIRIVWVNRASCYTKIQGDGETAYLRFDRRFSMLLRLLEHRPLLSEIRLFDQCTTKKTSPTDPILLVNWVSKRVPIWLDRLKVCVWWIAHVFTDWIFVGTTLTFEFVFTRCSTDN